MHPAKILPVKTPVFILISLLSNSCLAVESTPSLATQRLELESETKTIQASAAEELQRIEALRKQIEELSKNNATLDEQLQKHLEELQKNIDSPRD